MLSRRERRFADRQAEKILSQLRKENKKVQQFVMPSIIKPMNVNDLKQYDNERMRMQETTGDSEPTTNTGTNGEVDQYFDNIDDYHFKK